MKPRFGNRDRYVRAALERECEAVASAPVGGRNNILNSAAWSLARLELADHDLIDALMGAAAWAVSSQDQREAMATIRSGLRRRAS